MRIDIVQTIRAAASKDRAALNNLSLIMQHDALLPEEEALAAHHLGAEWLMHHRKFVGRVQDEPCSLFMFWKLDGLYLENMHLMKANFEGCGLSNATFRDCIFADCKFDKSWLNGAHFEHCLFINVMGQVKRKDGMTFESCHSYDSRTQHNNFLFNDMRDNLVRNVGRRGAAGRGDFWERDLMLMMFGYDYPYNKRCRIRPVRPTGS